MTGALKLQDFDIAGLDIDVTDNNGLGISKLGSK